jgi:hypothetical protein
LIALAPVFTLDDNMTVSLLSVYKVLSETVVAYSPETNYAQSYWRKRKRKRRRKKNIIIINK